MNAKSRLLKGENGGVWVGRLTVTRLSDVPAIKIMLGLEGVHRFLPVDSENLEWSLMPQPNPTHKQKEGE